MKPVKQKILSKDEKNMYVKKRHSLELDTCKKTNIDGVKTARNTDQIIKHLFLCQVNEFRILFINFFTRKFIKIKLFLNIKSLK